MKPNLLLFAVLSIVFLNFSSCKKDDVAPTPINSENSSFFEGKWKLTAMTEDGQDVLHMNYTPSYADCLAGGQVNFDEESHTIGAYYFFYASGNLNLKGEVNFHYADYQASIELCQPIYADSVANSNIYATWSSNLNQDSLFLTYSGEDAGMIDSFRVQSSSSQNMELLKGTSQMTLTKIW